MSCNLCLQEMTEEGVPLLILFYHPNEPEIKELFKSRVAEELADQKGVSHDCHMIRQESIIVIPHISAQV